MDKHNPILDQIFQDPFEPQKNQLKAVQEEQIELQRLCFEIFHVHSEGKRLYEMILKRFIIPARYAPNDPNAPYVALYWEGFKEAMRGLYDQGLVHAKRINEGGSR